VKAQAPRLGTLALLALLLALLPAAAGAAGPAGTKRALDRAMRDAGRGSGAYAVDLASGRTIYASRPDTRRAPASVEKLFTTSTALLALGPEARLATDVLGAAPVDEDGVLAGDLYLRGGGDPTFGTQRATALARLVVEQTGLQRVEGALVGDETAFDTRRGPPSEGYVTSGYVGPLSALPFNRGLTGVASPYFQASPGLFATQAFARALKAEGVELADAATTGQTPAGAVPLAAAMSPTIAELVAMTNVPSDNYFAETLIKVLGARLGGGGTTRRGARVVRATMRGIGVRTRPVDGSGLSRSNRTSPRQVVRLLRAMAANPTLGPVLDASLPVAGRSGTLTGRMRRTAAANACHAKTGSLDGVSALAGYCVTRGGDTRVAFAILMNRVNVWGARALQDRMAAALARYTP
jgi:D-alanyl-D-alanine carboxypeptidase/D-alanyl-D-alanine-endopeptidase (penicillin-binding protein 4)